MAASVLHLLRYSPSFSFSSRTLRMFLLLCLDSQSRFLRGFLLLDYLASSCDFRSCVLIRISVASALSIFRCACLLSLAVRSFCLVHLLLFFCDAPGLAYCSSQLRSVLAHCDVASCSRLFFFCLRVLQLLGGLLVPRQPSLFVFCRRPLSCPRLRLHAVSLTSSMAVVVLSPPCCVQLFLILLSAAFSCPCDPRLSFWCSPSHRLHLSAAFSCFRDPYFDDFRRSRLSLRFVSRLPYASDPSVKLSSRQLL